MRSNVIGRLGISIIAASLITMLLLSGPALADIVIPTSLYGTIAIDGSDAPVGTVITAKINGVELGSYTTHELGKYGNSDPNIGDVLVVSTDTQSDIGETIEFWINGIGTDQTAIFDSETQQLNLVLGTTQETATEPSESTGTATHTTVTKMPTSKAEQTTTPEVSTALSDEVMEQEVTDVLEQESTAPTPTLTPTVQADENEDSSSSVPMVGVSGVLAILIITIVYINRRKYV